MKALGLLLLLAPLIAIDCGAQTSGASFGDDGRIFLQDWGEVLTAPGSFSGKDWLLVGAALGATAAAWTVDEELREWSQARRTPAVDDWVLAGDYYGRGETSTGLAVVLYAGGEIFDDEWSRITGRMILQSLVYSEFVTHSMKAIIGRSRPFAGRGNADFAMFTFDHERTSFPSGHTTAAFALSTTLARRIGSPPATIVLFSFAALTAVQRIASDSHWLSDTVLGAAIGTATAWAVSSLEIERERERERERVIVPLSAQFHRPHVPLMKFSVGL